MIFQGSPDDIILLDQEGRILSASHVAKKRVGASVQELIDEKSLEMATERVIKYWLKISRKVLEEGIPQIFQEEKEGKFFCNIFIPLKIPGQPDAVQAISRDVTVQVLIHKALKKDKDYLECILGSMPDMLLIISSQGKLTYINSALSGFTGIDLKTIKGKSIKQAVKKLNIFSSDTTAIISKRIRQYLKTDKPATDIELEMINIKGEKVPCIYSVTGIRGSDGDVLGQIVVIKDISVYKRAEEALREEKKFSDSLIASMQDGFAVLDKNGIHIDANPAFCQMIGYSWEELAEIKPPYPYWSTEDLEAIQHSFRKTLQGDLEDNEFYFIHKNGKRFPVILSPSCVRDKQGEINIIFASIKDITEWKKAEDLLQLSLKEKAHSHLLMLALSKATSAVQRCSTPEGVYRTVAGELIGLGYDAVILTLSDDQMHLIISYVTFNADLIMDAEKLIGISLKNFSFPLLPGTFFQRIIDEGLTTHTESLADCIFEDLPESIRSFSGQISDMLGFKEGIIAPLKVGDETHGLVVVTGAGLNEADIPAMNAFANQSAIAIKNTMLLGAVTKHRKNLQKLSTQIINAQEAERKKISRELHDEFGQTLTAMKINLAAIEKESHFSDTPLVRERLSETNALVEQILDQVRELSLDLRPTMLDDLGLVPTLRWYLNSYAKRLKIKTDFEVINFKKRLDSETETVLYRVFQEALTNVARHAQASRVCISLKRRKSIVVAFVEDDGRGFDAKVISERESPEHGTGLLGIRERVAFSGGTMNIQSSPGKGTKLSIEIPL